MSLEQADPKREELGPWTDVYGIGATLYALLTGRPPFRAASQYAVVDQVLHTEPVAPRLLTPTVDRDIDTICMKCLEKSPQRRYQSARELADELRRFEEGKPIQARRISRLERSMRWCRRNRLAAAFIAVLGLVTLLLAVGGPIVAFRERDRAIRETQLRQDRDIARQDADENLGRQSLTAARTAMQRGRWDEARTALSTARDFYHDTVEVDVERIRVLQALGDVVESARESQRLLAQDPPDPWRATINLLHGDVLLLQNAPDEALEFIQRALDAEAGLDEAQRAYALALLASTPDAAIQRLREALHLDPFYYKARTQLVASLLMRGKRQEARDELVKALAMYPEDPNFAVFQAMLEAIEGNAADGMASVLSADEQFAANQKAAIYAAIEVCGRLAKLMDTWREGQDYEASQELLFNGLLRLRGNAEEAEEHDVHSRFQYVVVRLPPAFGRQNDDVRRVLQLSLLQDRAAIQRRYRTTPSPRISMICSAFFFLLFMRPGLRDKRP
jgi:tetratricopeptide (TPR) repeat protein